MILVASAEQPICLGTMRRQQLNKNLGTMTPHSQMFRMKLELKAEPIFSQHSTATLKLAWVSIKWACWHIGRPLKSLFLHMPVL